MWLIFHNEVYNIARPYVIHPCISYSPKNLKCLLNTSYVLGDSDK